MHLWWIRNSRVVSLRCLFAAMTMVRKKRSQRSWISLDGKQRTWEKLRERVQSNHSACCGASPASYVPTGRMLSNYSRKVESSVDALTCDEPPATADFHLSLLVSPGGRLRFARRAGADAPPAAVKRQLRRRDAAPGRRVHARSRWGDSSVCPGPMVKRGSHYMNPTRRAHSKTYLGIEQTRNSSSTRSARPPLKLDGAMNNKSKGELPCP